MLALQICGVAVTYLAALPTQQWLDLTTQAYGCPVTLTQAHQITGLGNFLDMQERTQGRGQWRVLPVARINEVRAGDALLLPAEPSTLLWQPSLRRQLRDAQAGGTPLVLDAPEQNAVAALATTYTGLGLVPAAALLEKPPLSLNTLPAGTYLLRQVGGLPLLPHPWKLGAVEVIPYLPEATQGQWAAPSGDATTMHLTPSLSWQYGGAAFSSAQPPEGKAAWLSRLMVPVWAVGRILQVPLPSLIYVASDTVAWVVLGLLILTLLALLRSVLRRPIPAEQENG